MRARPQVQAGLAVGKFEKEPLDDARSLFRSMRLQGLDEESLRQFACKFAGPNWEPFYEGLFGYEAKLAARAYRKGDTGEPWAKHGTWREPVIGWLDARLEARKVARERAMLQKVEAKALEAKRKAEETMANQTARLDYAKAQAELMEAVAQLAAIQRLRKRGH